MGERMKKIFILGMLLCVTTARAEIPTMQYLYEFYERECGWSAEMGLPDMIEEFLQEATGQTIPKSAIATQWMPLAFVDSFNGNTTYAQDLTTNNVVSVGYLQSSLDLIDSPMCCKNGLQFDPGSFSCVGGAFDISMCKAYIHEPISSCPDGWEWIYLRDDVTMQTGDNWCPDGTREYIQDISDDCIAVAVGNDTSRGVTMCLPSVENGTISANAATGDWSISNGDVTYVTGYGECEYMYDTKDYRKCVCYSGQIMSMGGRLVDNPTHSTPLKLYDTAENCAANCAYECAYAVQTIGYFRHTLLLNQRVSCNM